MTFSVSTGKGMSVFRGVVWSGKDRTFYYQKVSPDRPGPSEIIDGENCLPPGGSIVRVRFPSPVRKAPILWELKTGTTTVRSKTRGRVWRSLAHALPTKSYK